MEITRGGWGAQRLFGLDIALRAARQRYGEGVIDFLNVNSAQGRLLQSQNEPGGGWEAAAAAGPGSP